MVAEYSDRWVYFPILNNSEYERISNVNSAKDYLLKLRADTIVDNMRLFRVYRNKALMNEQNWSLEKSFSTKPYDMFLDTVDPEIRIKCSKLTYGNIFSNDPNGCIANTEYGPIITVSDSLKFYFKFMNMALLDFEDFIPERICKNAIRIAIRVMLQTEALDFLMDPRGMVPEEIFSGIHEPIDYEMMFIVGHEFAHYIFGHLKESNSAFKPILFAISDQHEEYMPINVFNQSQVDEFEADIQSLVMPQLNRDEYKKLYESTILWFGSLELYETVIENICPKNPWDLQTHPTARQRMDNILDKAKKPYDFNLKEWSGFKSSIEYYKEWLKEDIAANLDLYEIYGSAYLDEPNTEWRGRKLVDGVDYY